MSQVLHKNLRLFFCMGNTIVWKVDVCPNGKLSSVYDIFPLIADADHNSLYGKLFCTVKLNASRGKIPFDIEMFCCVPSDAFPD